MVASSTLSWVLLLGAYAWADVRSVPRARAKGRSPAAYRVVALSAAVVANGLAQLLAAPPVRSPLLGCALGAAVGLAALVVAGGPDLSAYLDPGRAGRDDEVAAARGARRRLAVVAAVLATLVVLGAVVAAALLD